MTRKRESVDEQPVTVRLRVSAQVIHEGKLYLPSESTLVDLTLAEAIAAAYPDAGATWTDYAQEKAAEDARAAELDAAAAALQRDQ